MMRELRDPLWADVWWRCNDLQIEWQMRYEDGFANQWKPLTRAMQTFHETSERRAVWHALFLNPCYEDPKST